MSEYNKDITDKIYKQMSEAAYRDFNEGFEVEELPGWEVLDQKYNSSGMDAVTFYNPNTKQAVIAFRGTEGNGPEERRNKDLKADVLNIALPEAEANAVRGYFFEYNVSGHSQQLVQTVCNLQMSIKQLDACI